MIEKRNECSPTAIDPSEPRQWKESETRARMRRNGKGSKPILEIKMKLKTSLVFILFYLIHYLKASLIFI